MKKAKPAEPVAEPLSNSVKANVPSGPGQHGQQKTPVPSKRIPSPTKKAPSPQKRSNDLFKAGLEDDDLHGILMDDANLDEIDISDIDETELDSLDQ